MPYEFTSFSEEITSWLLVFLVSVALFALIRIIENIEYYDHLLFIQKPLKCKKCKKPIGLLRSCKHAKHSIIASLFCCVSFGLIFPVSIYAVIPYFENIEYVSPYSVCGDIFNHAEWLACIDEHTPKTTFDGIKEYLTKLFS